MYKLDETQYKSCVNTQDTNRFLNDRSGQSLAERFNSFLLENYHYERSYVLGHIFGTDDRELRLLKTAHYLFSEMLLLRKKLDAEDDRREVLLDTACDIAAFIQKMCGVWVL